MQRRLCRQELRRQYTTPSRVSTGAACEPIIHWNGCCAKWRRTRTVGAFPDGKSALMLAAARLRHVAGTKWGTRRYLDMDRLAEVSEAA